MALPGLTDAGELPIGVHPASLEEVLARFGGGHVQRIAVGERLQRIYDIAVGTGHLARFVVYGSFVTNKPQPNDVDVFLVMDEKFDGEVLDAESTLLLDHTAADAHFGASVFWVRRPTALGGEQAMVEYWQVKRGNEQRGIVEITGESNDQK